MYDLKDYLNSVNYKKNNLMVEDGDEFWEKKYPTFIVNKCVSGFADTVLFANEMNGFHHMDKKLQYDFYLHGLPKKKRFSPWMKAHKIKNLDLVISIDTGIAHLSASMGKKTWIISSFISKK